MTILSIDEQSGRCIDKGENTERVLYPMIKNSHVEFGMETLPISSRVPKHRHQGQSEIIFIHFGHVEIGIESKVFQLSSGMAIEIPADTTHYIVNIGETIVHLTYTLTPPTSDGLESLKHLQ
jgi:quercetin dioxygenase-like cupin family protein